MLMFQTLTGREGFRYIVGYVQRRVKLKFPNLEIQPGQPKDGWIEKISRGFLTIPNCEIQNQCEALESIFIQFNSHRINMDPDPIKKLTELGKAHCPTSIESNYIVELYMKMRFFQRIKFLNTQLKADESSEKIRKLKQSGQHIY